MEWQSNNEGAEQSLIGALVKSGGNDKVFETIRVDDFFNKTTAKFYEVITGLKDANTAIDFTTVAAQLSDHEFTTLGDMIRSTPSAANIYGYAKIVADKAVERDTLIKLNEAMQIVKGGGNTQENGAQVLSLINKINTDDNDEKPEHIGEIAKRWFDTYEERLSEDGTKGLKTGITGLDTLFGNRGVGDTDLVIIGGRSKMGKTALSVMVAEAVAKAGKHTLVFSMEMPKTQIFERFLTQGAKVSGDKFYQHMDDYEFARVGKVMADMRDNHLYIDDRPNLSMNQIKSACRRHMEEHGELGAVFVDYFTLMKAQEGFARHDLATGANSNGLKAMAKELKFPVFLLAQLSRGVDSRPNKRPLISDLRESGSLEQDADAILFLYKDSVYHPENGLGGLTEVILAANRHGEAGTAFVEMKGGWFENISELDVNHLMSEPEKQKEW